MNSLLHLLKLHSILILAALLLSFASRAQENFPFPDSAAVWVQSWCYPTTSEIPPVNCTALGTSNICISGEDTVFNGITYKKVEQCNGGYVGALMAGSSSVYFMPKDSTQAFLFYDFEVAIGDTVRNVFIDENLAYNGYNESAQLVEYVVYQIDQNSGRKEIYLNDPWGPGQVWIEGFGSPFGLFSRHTPISIIGTWSSIDCMSHLDTMWYYWIGIVEFAPGNCTLQTVGLPDVERAVVSIYPNPAQDQVQVVLPPSIISAELMDLQGRNIEINVPISTELSTISIGHLPDGIYFLELRSTSGVYRMKLIKSAER